MADPPEYEAAARSVTWELTLRCNARCAHCASSAGRPREEELTTEEALALCEDLPGIGTEHVCLFGGEALLHPDWELIARRLTSLGVDVSLATNGLALTETVARTMMAAGVVGVSISVDAATPALHDEIRGRAGAWRRAQRALDLCLDLGFRELTVITSVSRRNLGELDGLAELLSGRAEDLMWMINLATVHDPTRFHEDQRLDGAGYRVLAETVDRLRRERAGLLDVTGSHDLGYFSGRLHNTKNFEWRGCRAGIDTLGIRSDGKVKGCLILPDRHVQGDLRTRPLRDIWRDPALFLLNRAFREELLTGRCRGCLYGPLCQGGCSEVAETTTGSPYHYPFCLYRDERDALEGDGEEREG